MSGQFVLSYELGGHDGPVRDVAWLDGGQTLAVGVQTGQVAVWRADPDRPAGWIRVDVHRGKVHEGLLLCVAAVPPTVPGLPDGAVVTGGSDKVARFVTTHGSVLPLVLSGHTEPVCSVSFSHDGCVVTGSWDGSVRVWEAGRPKRVISAQESGHEYATEVLVLPGSGLIVAGSARGRVTIMSPDGSKLLLALPRACDGPVRKLVPHPLGGFAVAANDGYLRVFGADGDLLLQVAAHVAGPTDTFCYGVAALPDGGLVSCGEDSTVRVWAPDGSARQVIQHPGAVRAVLLLPNGDLVTACTDRTARVFTLDPARAAPAAGRAAFEQAVEEAKAAGMEAVDPATLPTEAEALSSPGSKEGAIKVVRGADGKAWVHRWAGGEWAVVGEAVGRKHKSTLDGKEYDHVTDVFVTEDRSVKLGWNVDDDPDEVAASFCARYQLGPEVKDQVASHVRPLTDAQARARRLASSFRQLPCWRTGPFQLFTGVREDPLRRKLGEFNAALRAAGRHDLAVDDSLLGRLADSATREAAYHVAAFPDDQVEALTARLLAWPVAYAVPVLDMYRALMLHQDAVRRVPPTAVAAQLFALVGSADASPHVPMLVARAVANWLGKRVRSAGERREGAAATAPPDVDELVERAATVLAPRLMGGDQAATLSFLLHNAVRWFGSVGGGRRGHRLVDVLAQPLAAVALARPQMAAEPRFYAILALGSLACCPGGAGAVKAMLGSDAAVQTLIDECSSSSVAAAKELGSDLRRVLVDGQTP